MNHLVVFAHPNPESFGKAIKEVIIKASEKRAFNTRVKDLYDEKFNPVLAASDFEAFRKGEIPSDIKKEQELVTWADIITFVYPVWWAGLPAILKGYIDRVFSYGFAYEARNGAMAGLLGGRRVRLFSTTGTPDAVYSANGMYSSMKQTQDAGIFGVSGIDDVEHIFFAAVPSVDDGARAKYLDAAEKTINKL